VRFPRPIRNRPIAFILFAMAVIVLFANIVLLTGGNASGLLGVALGVLGISLTWPTIRPKKPPRRKPRR
jgi:hypothetical protein